MKLTSFSKSFFFNIFFFAANSRLTFFSLECEKMHVEIYPRKYFVADSSKSTRHMNLDWLRFRQRKRAFVLLVVCIRCVFISLRFWVLVFAGYVFRVDGKRIRNKMIADKNEFCSG
jgi:hypothetical protein